MRHNLGFTGTSLGDPLKHGLITNDRHGIGGMAAGTRYGVNREPSLDQERLARDPKRPEQKILCNVEIDE